MSCRPPTDCGCQFLQLATLRFVGGLKLDQQAGCGWRQRSNRRRNAGLVFDRTQRGAIHDLQCLRSGVLERHDGGRGGVEIGKQQQPGVLHRQVGHGVEHGFGDEGQRAFGADQHVLEDIDGAVEIEEGVQRVAGGVLHPVLAADALAQRGIGFQSRLSARERRGQVAARGHGIPRRRWAARCR